MKKAIIIFFLATFGLAFLVLVEPITKAMETKDSVKATFSSRGQELTGHTVETTVINEHKNGGTSTQLLSEKEAKVVSLGEVTINDLVLDTYYPFGEETEDDEKDENDRFRNITIKTPGKQWWDIHPEDDEVAAYRQGLIDERIEAKRKAYQESKKNATPTPTPSPAPTKIPSASPTPTPRITATPTPEPEPDFSLTEEELQEVEKEVAAWYAENSYVEERDIETSVTFSGEQVRAYVNSYHPEWQVAYMLSLMVEYFHDTNPGGDETQISKDIEEAVCRQLTEGYDFELMIDYWSSSWGDKWSDDYRTLSLEEGDLSTSYWDASSSVNIPIQLYDKVENDYTNNRLESEPDLLKEEYIVPFVLFRSINAWSEDLTFGECTYDTNEYGFPEQRINSRKVGSIFLNIISIYDLPNSELLLMKDAIEALPEAEEAFTRWSYAVGELNSSGGYLFEKENITWLAGDDVGMKVAKLALEQVGKIYSNERRKDEGYFDCSSLTYYLYKKFAIDLSWNGTDVAAAQCEWSDKRNKTLWTYYNEAGMRPGDLIFWQTKNVNHVSYGRYKHVYHVGVYIGNGIIVDASSSVGCVVCRQMWGIDEVIGVSRPYE